MAVELTVLGWSIALGFALVLWTAQVRTRAYGRDWNMGARDTTPTERRTPLIGRLERAQANFMETFPFFAAAALGAVAAGRTDDLTALGAWLYLGGRAAHAPLYVAGVPVARTLAWAVSVAGIALVARGLF